MKKKKVFKMSRLEMPAKYYHLADYFIEKPRVILGA